MEASVLVKGRNVRSTVMFTRRPALLPEPRQGGGDSGPLPARNRFKSSEIRGTGAIAPPATSSTRGLPPRLSRVGGTRPSRDTCRAADLLLVVDGCCASQK